MDYEVYFEQVQEILTTLDWDRTLGAAMGAGGSLVAIWIVGRTLDLLKTGIRKSIVGFWNLTKKTIVAAFNLFRSAPSDLYAVLREVVQGGHIYLNGSTLNAKGIEFLFSVKELQFHKVVDVKVGKDSVITKLSQKEKDGLAKLLKRVYENKIAERDAHERQNVVEAIRHLQTT